MNAIITTKNEDVTAEFFEKRYPDVCAEIRKIGYDEGYPVGFERGRSEGLKAGQEARRKQEETFKADFTKYKNEQAASVQASTPEPKSTLDEEICKHDPKLRAEFGNNFDSFVAYRKAEKAVKIKLYGR
ncbi:MAG: hypothetical protein FJ264_17595 [Planctomycetes bacterium]|nr:hypothetical protein [Planctomycetota bacterium]